MHVNVTIKGNVVGADLVERLIGELQEKIDQVLPPLPVYSDDELEMWARYYERANIASFGVPFIAFMRAPQEIGQGLIFQRAESGMNPRRAS